MQEQAEKYFNKGVGFLKLGYHEKAVDAFDKALAIEPDNDMLWVLRGSLLDDLGRYADSLTSYDKALAIKPDYSVAWCCRGIALRKLGRYADSVASLDRALVLNPLYADAKKQREMSLQEEVNSRHSEDVHRSEN